jgi:antitoxin FitA
MPAITVRNIPDDVRNELAARAARAGQSMQEYLREQLVELASRPTVSDLLARIRADLVRSNAPEIDRNTIVETIRADRAR